MYNKKYSIIKTIFEKLQILAYYNFEANFDEWKLEKEMKFSGCGLVL
jgi:hypothetical protein